MSYFEPQNKAAYSIVEIISGLPSENVLELSLLNLPLYRGRMTWGKYVTCLFSKYTQNSEIVLYMIISINII